MVTMIGNGGDMAASTLVQLSKLDLKSVDEEQAREEGKGRV